MKLWKAQRQYHAKSSSPDSMFPGPPSGSRSWPLKRSPYMYLGQDVGVASTRSALRPQARGAKDQVPGSSQRFPHRLWQTAGYQIGATKAGE